MKKLLIAMTAIAITSAGAEEWKREVGKNPGNKPTKDTQQINPKLDFVVYKTNINDKPHLSVKVRNAKHKMGEASISVQLENASLVVQRVEISIPMSVVESKSNGEHLMDTFTASGKSYDIFYNVKNGKLDPTVVIKSK